MLMARLVPVASCLLAITACDARSVAGPTAEQPLSSSLAIAANQSDANWRIDGSVLGDRTTLTSSDTGGTGGVSVSVPEHVAGVRIVISREVRDSTGTGPTRVTDTYIGTVVSAANGTFSFTAVPQGYYRIDLTPPEGSPYASGSGGTEAFSGTGSSTAVFTLRSK